jgi:hypothetical protein
MKKSSEEKMLPEYFFHLEQIFLGTLTVVVLRTSIDHMGYTCCICSKAKSQ